MARDKRTNPKNKHPKNSFKRFEAKVKWLKSIDWSMEIVKSILTAFIVFLISTFAQGFIANYSPGEYSDNRLKQYLMTSVSQEIGAGYSGDQITISRELYGFQNSLSITDAIILCGEYASDPAFPDGYYICIFERTPKSFFNDLFRTKPKYVPTFIRTIDSYYAGIEMSCVSCTPVDVDNDGLMEVRIEFWASFADRTSQITAIIERVNECWKIISPDLSTIEDEATKIANKVVYPYIESFPLTNPQNPEESEILYGLYNYGYILPISNKWTGGIDWLYCITIGQCVEDKQYWNSAFVMERLVDNEIMREPDWNVGSIYFPEHENREIEEFVEDLWGWSPDLEYNVPWDN